MLLLMLSYVRHTHLKAEIGPQLRHEDGRRLLSSSGRNAGSGFSAGLLLDIVSLLIFFRWLCREPHLDNADVICCTQGSHL